MRIYTSTDDAIDLCRPCAAQTPESAARQRWGHLGHGPDDRGDCFAYDAYHPRYDEVGDDYTCDLCGRILTNRD